MGNDYLEKMFSLLGRVEYTSSLLIITANNSKQQQTTTSDYTLLTSRLVQTFSDIKHSGGSLYFLGNGGSAAIAIHMTADFFKRGEMNTVSLYDPSMITMLGNDYGYEYIFSKQLERFVHKGDLVVAISSSGKSPNIINAASAAKDKGAHVLSFTGFEPDNPVRSMSDESIYVPSSDYGLVESIHNLILQQIVDLL